MNRFTKCLWLAACIIGVQTLQFDSANAAGGCGPNQVYSSSMGRCIPKSPGR